jgi:hypothetical protein
MFNTFCIALLTFGSLAVAQTGRGPVSPKPMRQALSNSAAIQLSIEGTSVVRHTL